MKKALLSLSFAIVFISLTFSEVNAQVCVPDPIYTQPGVWPDSVTGIDTAYQCQPYTQILTLIVPIDTVFGGFDLWIDSIVLTGIGGLPPGLSYACEPKTCGLPGGTSGCVLISGIPKTSGIYNLDAYTTAYVTDKTFGFSTTQQDTISYYDLVVEQTLVLSSTAVNASCNGICDGTATIIASGAGPPYTYLWNDPGAQTDSIATGLCAGVYGVTVSDTTGCYNVKVVTITNGSLLVTSTSATDASCGMPNGTATAITTGGTATYTYIWSSGDTNSVISSLLGGNYTVSVTDASGCTDSASVTVGSVAAMVLTSSSSFSTCGNSDGAITISVSGGTAPYNGWGVGMTDTTISPLSSGSYTYVFTDAMGCMDSITTMVSDSGGLALIDSAVTMVSCNGVCDGAAIAVASGAVGPLTYSWNTIPIQTTAAASGLCAGPNVATVNDSVCTTSLTVTITEPGAIVISSEMAVNPLCNGAGNDSIVIIAGGGSGTLSYSIDNGITYMSSGVFTGMGDGTYAVMVADSLCTVTGSTLTITEPDAVVIDSIVQSNVSCNGLMDGAVSVYVSGGVGTIDYSLDGGANYNNTSGSFIGLGASTLDIAVRDANLCPGSGGNITIIEPAALSISTSSTPESAVGASDGSATVLANGGTGTLTFAWNTTPPQSTATAASLSAGDYIVVVTDVNGCTISDTATVGVGTSFEEISKILSVRLYPNPVQNELNIEVSLNYNFTFIAYDVRGKQVLVEGMSGGKNNISMANLSTGLYVYYILNDSGVALSHGKFNVLK